MNFDACISHMYYGKEMRHFFDAYALGQSKGFYLKNKNPTPQKFLDALLEHKAFYTNPENIAKALSALRFSMCIDTRNLCDVFLHNILLETENYCCPKDRVNQLILDFEDEVLEKESKIKKNKLPIESLLYRETMAFAYTREALPSQETLEVLACLQQHAKIDDYDALLLKASAGVYPNFAKSKHTIEEKEDMRNLLQKAGLICSIKLDDVTLCDIIPEEIAEHLKKIYAVEVCQGAYLLIIDRIAEKYKKQYLCNALKASKIPYEEKASMRILKNLVFKHLKPSLFILGKKTEDGLDRVALSQWCSELGLAKKGSKEVLLSKIFEYYTIQGAKR